MDSGGAESGAASDRLRISGIGASVDLRPVGAHAPQLLGHLRRLWARCLSHAGSESAATLTVNLAEGHADLPRTPNALEIVGSDLSLLLERTTQAITSALIAARAGKLLMFHAGGVSHPVTGKSLVFVAESRTGKTTLAKLLATQLGYLSDETIGIDEELRIHPYPKPLSVRSDDGHAREEISPDALHLLPAHEQPTLSRLVILDRNPSHLGPPQVEEIDLFDAIITLAPQTSSLSALPQGLQRIADLVAHTGSVLRLRYAEAQSLVPLATELIGAPA